MGNNHFSKEKKGEQGQEQIDPKRVSRPDQTEYEREAGGTTRERAEANEGVHNKDGGQYTERGINKADESMRHRSQNSQIEGGQNQQEGEPHFGYGSDQAQSQRGNNM